MDSFQARDKSDLFFHYYPAESDNVMILLHGISEDHKYLSPIADFIANENLAHVYTPDLRGYGKQSIRRGDLDYIGQHEDDLMDFINWINRKHNNPTIILAGHSAGGGTTLRFAVSSYSEHIHGYLLLAPFIHPFAPTTPKKNENSSSSVSFIKLLSLMLLNRLRITKFNNWMVYTNNKPEHIQHGRETLQLSYRLFFSRFPHLYKDSLKALHKPTLVLVGDKDEEFVADQYHPLFTKYNNAKVHMISEANHDGILSHPVTYQMTKKWIEEVFQ
ncbi:alpha/beta hydrolase [Bacillus sp. Marseille-P3661]|uniref:alpha/beta hydrolase n=1 Tax=Bacillus sp. Marseille-P3661 TaxID=1936234 RepID=UPI000C82441B|nr:alpha/beta hydrolase [Bacillus sp. Marseille-P3661]